jgi:sulfur-oxidizing protein SoxX
MREEQTMPAAFFLIALLVVLLPAGQVRAQSPAVDAARMQAAVNQSWAQVPPDWRGRLAQDETMIACSQYRNSPPRAVADAIVAREKASIKYPADGKLMGDWKKGQKLAQSGYGGRFTDYPPRTENGGNCYACHQLSSKELSFGTLGPSLSEYGKNRKFSEADVKAVYDRIYNPQAAVACASMPRLGANGHLSIEQIKDLVAYVMSPDSPVNK